MTFTQPLPYLTAMLTALNIWAISISVSAEPTSSADQSPRVRSGLLVLYDFSTDSGAAIKDRSGVGSPLNLRVRNPQAVHRQPGSLQVRSASQIRCEQTPHRMITSIRRSGEITIEAWIRPANVRQQGPARIVSLSQNGSNRNFTLGQDGDKFDVRLRTTSTTSNGLPSISTAAGTLKTALTHVAYTRTRSGRATIYLNGESKAAEKVDGSLRNWDDSFRLTLANENGGGRPWLGTYNLVAVYSRSLTADEVRQNFRAGAEVNIGQAEVATDRDQRAQHFETSIAPLLSHHCLECHDSSTREGGLDLSRRNPAFRGGDSGQSLIPGNAAESQLWEVVNTDEMPADRIPLTPDEKRLLKKWIDDGAVWSIDQVDPAVYVHGNQKSQNWVRRLTIPEYIETVRYAVGVDISQDAIAMLPPDLRADGFSNTSYNLNVDLKHVECYARLADQIVSQMDVASFARRFSKRRKFTDKAMGDVITKMGRWLLRGPVAEHEVIAYRGISTSVASTGGDFDTAIGLIIEAMLQSPRFIYRIENQRGDGSSWPIDEYELASRLSYILWGGPPDQELMSAAENGSLYDPSQVESQIDRMLADPRAVEHSLRFAAEWLNLSRIDKLRPDAKRFPDWSEQLAGDMREETLLFFEEVVWNQRRPMSDLLNAQLTFATPRLARHYGLVAGQEEEFQQYDLADNAARGGLLTQASLLTVGGDEASMVTRGLFVMHDFLRGVVKDPPPCVDVTPVPTKQGLTQRSIAMERIGNATCGGCHAKFEPLAFGLEKYDGIGAFNDQDEHGNRLREDGQLLIPGTAQASPFETAAEMMNLLAGSDRVRHSIAWKLTQFSLGRPLVAEDASIVAQIHRTSQQNGGTYVSLMKALTLSDLVQLTRTEADELE